MLTTQDMFTVRKPLSEICTTPERIISVYSLEKYVWDSADPQEARKERRAELRTVEEFQINPVRHFLTDILRRMAMPYRRDQRENPIGQGYWLQAEFGSGKSHLLCFLSALALGDERAWDIVRDREAKTGRGRRDSLYTFWQDGLKAKAEAGRGLLVVGKTLVGAGSGAVGINDGSRPLSNYILDSVRQQYHAETGKNLSLYPAEMLADRFLQEDLERYRADLARFLRDPRFFDDPAMQTLDEFLKGMQDTRYPAKRLDCGQILWRFYTEYLKVQPDIPADQEVVFKHMVESLLTEGYQGLLLVLDEISLFAEGRTMDQKSEDEQTLTLLANRIAKIHNLPVWTVCAAQQKIVTRMGVGNILSDDRLKLVELLKSANDYYDIVLARVRDITDPAATHNYYDYYKHSFTWPSQIGEQEFARFFPFHKPALEVLRQITFGLTTCRSAIHIMHQTLKFQMARSGAAPDPAGASGTDLIRLWELFDEAVRYEEDAGSTHLLADIKTKWNDAAQAYESCRSQLNSAPRGMLKIHRQKAEMILQTLFLYHIAQTRQQGLTAEEIANSVLVPVDADASPADNNGDYETLLEELKRELPQIVSQIGDDKQTRYRFTPEMVSIRPTDEFNRARAEVANSERLQRNAWDRLLAMSRWDVRVRHVVHDMAHGTTSLFHAVAPFGTAQEEGRVRTGEQNTPLLWHGRQITGLVGMYDLHRLAADRTPLPRIDTKETERDFAVLISSRPLSAETCSQLLTQANDPRVILWHPAELSAEERNRLLDFGGYMKMISDHQKEPGSQTNEDIDLLNWVATALQTEIGKIASIVRSSYGRGSMLSRAHSALDFSTAGDLTAILEPVTGRVLDAVYASKDIHFQNLAVFRKEEAVKVINGVVRSGSIPPNARPDQDVSAAQNYGLGLKILKKQTEGTGKDFWKLDTTDNPFVEALWSFIDEKLSDNSPGMNLDTLYTNFMGIGGPHNKDYGLSKRLVQIYLLCLVQQGKIKITVNARASLPDDTIDYARISGITFSARILDALEVVAKVGKPQRWEALRPYAEKLLEVNLPAGLDDAAISQRRRELQNLFPERKTEARVLLVEAESLFETLKVPNPQAESLGRMTRLFATDLTHENDIDAILEAFEREFGYLVYREEEARTSEVDDLANRLNDYRNLKAFVGDKSALQAAYAYAHHLLPDLLPLADARRHQAVLAGKLQNIHVYIDSEVQRKSKLIGADPPVPTDQGTLHALLAAYGSHYLHLHEQCLTELEAHRKTIKTIQASEEMQAFQILEGITALQPASTPVLLQQLSELAGSLFACSSNNRNSVETQLRSNPVHECGLSFANNETYRKEAQQKAEEAAALFDTAVTRKFAVFLNPTVRQRLEQGRDEPVIADLLACTGLPETVTCLFRAALEDSHVVSVINRYLKQIVVRRVRLADFHPTITTVEGTAIRDVTAEFGQFLQAELAAIPDEKDVIPVLQLE